MGISKAHLMEIEERGYRDSDKNVCSFCIGDSYISNKIKYSHVSGHCSFCGKKRNVLPVNDVLEMIMKVINRDYRDAYGYIPFDEETHEYTEKTTDTYSLIHYELNDYLLIENGKILDELSDSIFLTDKVRTERISDFQTELDLSLWNDFCDLVNKTSLSAEQIVSLINNGNAHINQLPESLFKIKTILNTILLCCKEMHIDEIMYGLQSVYSAKTIYRVVDYLDRAPIEELCFIPASMVGTAPAKFVENNRMSEKGDMMFYGADSKKTAIKEYVHTKKENKLLTIGSFIPNKSFRILDLSSLSDIKIPSIFDVDNEEKRRISFFLREFMNSISQKTETSSDEAKVYRPTQVFTKYIQRNTKYAGIKYSSSKVKGGINYVLFVVNRDCLNTNDELNDKRYQLIMKDVEQIEM